MNSNHGKNSKIYVAGHTGLVRFDYHQMSEEAGYDNIIFRNIDELDLTCQQAVEGSFQGETEYVFLAAAMVESMVANNTSGQILFMLT